MLQPDRHAPQALPGRLPRRSWSSCRKDPAMIFWLDNQENTNDVHNENYGRELLELFSMGIGNYTEDDVKNCARAFTGWTLQEPDPGAQPFGRYQLGVRVPARPARLRREDVPRRDRQLRRRRHHRHHRAAAGHGAVHRPAALHLLRLGRRRTRPRSTSWPRCTSASGSTTSARSCGRCFCRTSSARASAYYAMVKSPAEHVVGVLRLVEDFTYPEAGASATWRSSAATWARI